ncbi:unnamed protein product [Hermetia illucens]|uniref:Methylenetetrahydrofolate reductase (NAD(P)H) n=1 Tax=Hermetia illucens TaxID=343691 RepID=A0A7R8YX16_HERIL|nr:methylenetetrahydrofolate reductase [Hermetia illucens]XP_037918223.1 methylenetetrahydrofolate reductase [Hermetia illucens]XP_037918224.1 methylenetetrahydrofolate reductase [Hermetia illucens]CAD7087407.1 unnamed protein product [Hermetia illucens]
MHAPSVDFPSFPPDGNIVNLANLAVPSSYSQLKIVDLIQEKINAREYFYGIEISPGLQQVLNYNLLKVAPLFTSIVWLASHNWAMESLDEAPAVRLAKRVEPNGPVLAHISCYNLTYDKLRKFLKPSINNVMVVRGDDVDEGQQYRHAADLVREIRKIRKDDICISVGGYPEGHPESTSMEDDLKFLKSKVDAGADLIITQLTFNEEALIEFIKSCRKIGITIPIVPGIYVPKSWAGLKFVSEKTHVKPPEELYVQYESRKHNQTEFREFAVQQAVKMIHSLFESDLGIYGVQFFTLNYFKNVYNIVQQVM